MPEPSGNAVPTRTGLRPRPRRVYPRLRESAHSPGSHPGRPATPARPGTPPRPSTARPGPLASLGRPSCRVSPTPSGVSSATATDWSPPWARVRPRTSTWPMTSPSTAGWPSRCSIRPWPATAPSSSASGPRPRPWPRSTTPTSSRSTTGARRTACRTWSSSSWPEAAYARSTTPGSCSPRPRRCRSASKRRPGSTTPTAVVWSTGTSSRPTCSSTPTGASASPTSAWPGPWPRRRGPSRTAPSWAPPATPPPSRSRAGCSTARPTSTPWPWCSTRVSPARRPSSATPRWPPSWPGWASCCPSTSRWVPSTTCWCGRPPPSRPSGTTPPSWPCGSRRWPGPCPDRSRCPWPTGCQPTRLDGEANGQPGRRGSGRGVRCRRPRPHRARGYPTRSANRGRAPSTSRRPGEMAPRPPRRRWPWIVASAVVVAALVATAVVLAARSGVFTPSHPVPSLVGKSLAQADRAVARRPLQGAPDRARLQHHARAQASSSSRPPPRPGKARKRSPPSRARPSTWSSRRARPRSTSPTSDSIANCSQAIQDLKAANLVGVCPPTAAQYSSTVRGRARSSPRRRPRRPGTARR